MGDEEKASRTGKAWRGGFLGGASPSPSVSTHSPGRRNPVNRYDGKRSLVLEMLRASLKGGLSVCYIAPSEEQVAEVLAELSEDGEVRGKFLAMTLTDGKPPVGGLRDEATERTEEQ